MSINKDTNLSKKPGFIKIFRAVYDHELFKENRTYSKLEAWIDILLIVNYEPNEVKIKGITFIVNRGETIRSLDTWASRWRWDKAKVRRFFSALENRKMIDTVTDTLLKRYATRLKVCNYDTYQDKKTVTDTLLERLPTPIKEYKEVSNKFIVPSRAEIEFYFKELNHPERVDKFINHYTANGWMVGKNKMKDWKAAARNSLDWTNGFNKPVQSDLGFKEIYTEPIKRHSA